MKGEGEHGHHPFEHGQRPDLRADHAAAACEASYRASLRRGGAAVHAAADGAAHQRHVTTKRAYEELEREGLIVTQTGRGSFVAEVSGERLREEQRRAVEKHLADAVHAAKMGGLTAEEFIEIAKTAFEEGEK